MHNCFNVSLCEPCNRIEEITIGMSPIIISEHRIRTTLQTYLDAEIGPPGNLCKMMAPATIPPIM